MGPEHGYFGRASAGKTCRTARHPDWKIPIYSLYGKNRQPQKKVLKNLDAVIFDLQDLGTRAYTYVSTLQLTLQAAAETGTPVIIVDRPIPLPLTCDGPMLQPQFSSFVAAIPAPLSYAMTPAETALWLQNNSFPNLKLHICKMRGFNRKDPPATQWPPWLRPSPSIITIDTAICFPATVAFEGLPAIDHGRATDMPFQLIGAPFINGIELADYLTSQKLPGIKFHPHRYLSRRADYHPKKTLHGIRLTVTNPTTFRPVLTGISIITAIQKLYGTKRVWNPRNCRPDFFDKLMGTDTVRLDLQSGKTAKQIAAAWLSDLKSFQHIRQQHLLYQ
jgi:uncharacterized protein YbbC (DUF1343 family)